MANDNENNNIDNYANQRQNRKDPLSVGFE
jgi:hypothetical protein